MSSPAWQFQMGDPDALNAALRTVPSILLLSLLAPLLILNWLLRDTRGIRT